MTESQFASAENYDPKKPLRSIAPAWAMLNARFADAPDTPEVRALIVAKRAEFEKILKDDAHKHGLIYSEHGFCANCGLNFDGGDILESLTEQYGMDAAEHAEKFGYGPLRRRWGKQINLVVDDHAVAGKCPSCAHEWPLL